MKQRILTALAIPAMLAGLAFGPASAASAAATATVHIKNVKYVPASLTVAPGSAVTFVNDDDEPHTATAANKSFDTDGLDTHQTWTHAFAKAGTYAYFCEMHPYMHGTVVVKAAP